MHHSLSNFLFLFIVTQIFRANCCINHERDALLEFKAGLEDPDNLLASWSSKECCNWEGIACSNKTGHIIKLNLTNCDFRNELSGKINPSFHLLSDLEHLDLSCNNFSGNYFPNFIISFKNMKYLNLGDNYLLSGSIPPELGNLSRLEYLDLSLTAMSGTIPPQLGNLSRLEYLDLGFIGTIHPQLGNLSRLEYLVLGDMHISVSNVWWLSHLTSLKYLDMGGLNFQDCKEWVQALSMLPLLQTLRIPFANLTRIPASIPVLNFSSLQSFDISDNQFNTQIPDWIWKLTKLIELDISGCSFSGHVPSQLANLNLLTTLRLGYNYLEGPIPPLHNLKNLTTLDISYLNIGEDIRDFLLSKLANETLGKLEELSLRNTSLNGNLTGWLNKMPNLITLDLSYNNLNGTIPDEIGIITSLWSLYLDDNYFTGVVSEIHLIGLSNLVELSLRWNNLAIRVGSNWAPTFQLEHLSLDGCMLGPHFPSWLRNQSQLYDIHLPNAGIMDTVPNWFWNLTSLSSVDLSHNQLNGRLPSSLEHLTYLYNLNLKNNSFEGEIPSLPHSLVSVDLSYNLLSGQLPTFIGAPSLYFLDLSNNYFNGTIEKLTCGLNRLQLLNLGRNNLSGELPCCWPNALQGVVMAHNKLSGIIPSSMSNLSSLLILQLNNNSLSGEIPSTLQFCRNLRVLDFGENNLYGQVPKWIGLGLLELTILRLQSNKFTGFIPLEVFFLTNLQILDIAHNNFSGTIPHNMELLKAMAYPGDGSNKHLDDVRSNLTSNIRYYDLSISLSTKGLDLEVTTVLWTSIDLSRNNLTGMIPNTITTLHGLRNLNLSNNQLTGPIPIEVGAIRSLESLDLHNNELSGIIPQSISNLNFLEKLNLSYNNLSGKIPTGNQLQTLNDLYMYVGNAYLCGSPLNKSCNPSIDEASGKNASKSSVDLEKVLLYLFIVLGFGFGFWIYFGMLLFKRNWRYQIFQMVDNWLEMLYFLVVSHFERGRKVLMRK